MELSGLAEVITTIGFPAAVCLFCFWYINKQDTNHKDEITKMTEAINNNTLVMQKLVDKIGGEM